MDSKKFKKFNNDAPKLKHKKKKPKIHYKNIFKVILVLIVIIIAVSFISNFITNASLPENAEVVYPTQFNFTPYGYEWNNELYGYCVATDSNQSEYKYYFTLNQMAALAYHSDNSYNYSDGLIINYTYDEKDDVRIVDSIFDSNKKEIVKPANYDEYKFSQNARFTCRNSTYCVDDFGFTPEEYRDSIFRD